MWENYLGEEMRVWVYGGVTTVCYVILLVWQQTALKWVRQDHTISGGAVTPQQLKPDCKSTADYTSPIWVYRHFL